MLVTLETATLVGAGKALCATDALTPPVNDRLSNVVVLVVTVFPVATINPIRTFWFMLIT